MVYFMWGDVTAVLRWCIVCGDDVTGVIWWYIVCGDDVAGVIWWCIVVGVTSQELYGGVLYVR